MYQKTVLANGVRIVTEEIATNRSVAIGVWVGVGSRHEVPEYEGVSHLIEHMFFKGTAKRSARQLAEALEKVGGHLNAFTSKEVTCYHARILDEDLDLAIDVLQDIFFNSEFQSDGLEKEKNVVIEEIKMYEDTPDELVHDLFSKYAWQNHPLGHPILGDEATIRGLNRPKILKYLESHYTPNQVVIAVAGRMKHEDVVAKLAVFAGFERSREEITAPPPLLIPFKKSFIKETEQTHLIIGTRGYAQEDVMTYPMHIVNSILGGGQSSYLFQEIREQRGLAYSIYSYHSSYQDTGLFAIYAGTNPKNTEEVIDCVMGKMEQLKKEGISAEELARTKAQLKGSMYLGMESTNSRMNRLGKTELTLGRVKTVEETVSRLESVTLEDIRELLSTIWIPENVSVLALGPQGCYKEGIPVVPT